MSRSKFSENIANWKLGEGDSPQGIQRNIRILVANGLKLGLAKRMAYRMAEGEISDPRAYLRELLLDSKNIAADYIQWVEGDFDAANIDPSVWEDIKDEEKPTYESKLKQRLQKIADDKREELRLQAAMEDETVAFWRKSPRKFSTSNLG